MPRIAGSPITIGQRVRSSSMGDNRVRAISPLQLSRRGKTSLSAQSLQILYGQTIRLAIRPLGFMYVTVAGYMIVTLTLTSAVLCLVYRDAATLDPASRA